MLGLLLNPTNGGIHSFETAVSFYHPTEHYIPQASTLAFHCPQEIYSLLVNSELKQYLCITLFHAKSVFLQNMREDIYETYFQVKL
jgi:hypothetical protein